MTKFFCVFSIIMCALPAYADIFSDLSQSLKYVNKRQSVIAKNLANADTPGYKAKDVVSPSSGRRLTLTTTSPMHVGGLGASPGGIVTEDEDTRYETMDGNTVVIEDQMLKMNQNNIEHRKTLGMMRKMTGLMRTAIGTK